MNINDKINFLIKKNMPVDIPNLIIDDSTDLVEDIGMDSICFFAFLLDLEEEFKINMLCFEIDSLKLGDIKKIVEIKLS